MTSIRKGVKKYLEFRWRLGFKLIPDKQLLAKFILFMERNKAAYVTTKLALDFAKLNPKGSLARWAVRLGIIRRFAEYWSAIDPRTEVPPLGLLPQTYRRRSPFIYSDSEISHLLQCCMKLPIRERYTYFILFGLLAVTGMRISEVIALSRDSFDACDAIIKVSKSKFQKSRYLPLHKSTVRVLQDYIRYRDRCESIPKTSSFLIDHAGHSLKGYKIRRVFHKLLKEAGIKKGINSRNPRIIDLRHSFAVKHLVQWYERRVSIDQQMPLLSTYLGHVLPTNTYWYLTATPELLRLISSRAERYKRRTS